MSAAQHHLRSQSLAVLRASNALHASLLPNSPPSPTLSTFLTSNTANPSAFSAVIAGEFNAGKSTFINALLGAEILKSGPLPTTDALCLISTPPDITGQDEVDYSEPTFTSRTSDGNVDVQHYTLSHVYGSTHSLLSSVTLIDTPGTNAVAELNHDALTKRLLPSADVVLFVTSCDQPVSESERELLRLVRGWGKKTVVVLNKMDVLEDGKQRELVKKFVEEKVGEIFDQKVEVIMVSARRALRGKVLASRELLPADAGVGAGDYLLSGFVELEEKLKSVLSEDNKIMHKLLSPVGLTESVLKSVEKVLEEKEKLMRGDMATLDLIMKQMTSWRNDLESETGKIETQSQAVFEEAIVEGSEWIVKTTKLVDIMYPDKLENSEGHPVTVLYDGLVTRRLRANLKTVCRKSAIAISAKTQSQSGSVSDFLNKRPLHMENTIARSNSMGKQVGGKDDIQERVWSGVREADVLGGELRNALDDVWNDARNRMIGGIAGMFVGGVGGAIAMVGVGGELGVAGGATGLGVMTVGAFFVEGTKRAIANGWKAECESVGGRVKILLKKGVQNEVEEVSMMMEMQVKPTMGYLEQEMNLVEMRTVECSELMNKNNEVRNEIIDESESLMNFSGGWRSEKKIV